MNSTTLVSIGQFDLKLNHLLIIGILSLAFSTSFLIRSQPADWGWELNEFDPFFNYRATQFIVDNGFDAYFEWNDELSWYPTGRDVSSNSQVMLHVIAAITYMIFGGGSDLYDFTILFPVIVGSLSCIVIFALVRVIGGTTAGLFSALLFSVSLPILIRGPIGWFKSEPLGLFLGLLGLYLFLSGLNSKNHKISLIKLIAAGIVIILAFSAWGGNQFFLIPLGVFFLVLPFVRSDHKFLLSAIPVFTLSTIITSMGFERLGKDFVTGFAGLSIIIPTVFLCSCILIQMKSNESHKTRNGLFFLAAILIISSSFLILNEELKDDDGKPLLGLPSYRYLNAINPFLTTSNPLVDSVAEHATTTLKQSFFLHSTLMIFAGIGTWLVFRQIGKNTFVKNDMISFSLILGIVGVYVSSAFLRLEVFASISLIILASLGLSILLKEFILNKHEINKFKKSIITSSYAIGVIILFLLPFTATNNVLTSMDMPPTILNGGTNFPVSTNDWNESLEWIKYNTPQDAVVASWWDYGYWIQTKAERATLADNSTISTLVIEKIAKIFLSTPDDGWKSLQDMGADYFVVFVAAQRFEVDGAQNQAIYALNGGGDESKKHWFMKIANEPLGKHLHSDGSSGTEHFWNETLLGQMIPFELAGYVNFQTNQQSLSYQPGFTAIYQKNIKLSENENGPLKLVHYSPSYDVGKGGAVVGVFVYEINDNYVPTN